MHVPHGRQLSGLPLAAPGLPNGSIGWRWPAAACLLGRGLDGFQRVIDCDGHQGGDNLLCVIPSTALRAAFFRPCRFFHQTATPLTLSDATTSPSSMMKIL